MGEREKNEEGGREREMKKVGERERNEEGGRKRNEEGLEKEK